MRRKVSGVTAALLLAALAASSACTDDSAAPSGAGVGPEIMTRVVDVGPLQVDGIYHSMDGPYERGTLDPSGIGWITGMRTTVLDADTDEPLGDELFCHSQLQLATSARLWWLPPASPRSTCRWASAYR